jgi:hypothetical protein
LPPTGDLRISLAAATRITATTALLLGTAVSFSIPALAEEQSDQLEMIKSTQNPLTRTLASITASNEFSFGLGPNDEFGYALLIKPSVPIVLSDTWTLISRTALPVIDLPSAGPDSSSIVGLGDIQQSILISPTSSRTLVLGLGPTVLFPSATDPRLGANRWALGPTAIIVATPRRSVFGILIENLWSVGEDRLHPDVNVLLMRPLATVNLPRGWFITSKPNISANWEAPEDQRWLVALGGGGGKVFRVGNLGISLEAEFFGYPVRPDTGPTWSARFDLKLLLHRGAVRQAIRERRP